MKGHWTAIDSDKNTTTRLGVPVLKKKKKVKSQKLSYFEHTKRYQMEDGMVDDKKKKKEENHARDGNRTK